MELVCSNLPTTITIEPIFDYFNCINMNNIRIKDEWMESSYSKLNSDKGYFKMEEIPQQITLNSISYKNTNLNLKKQLFINSYYESDMYFIENKNLNIISYGNTFEDALNSFQEDFLYLWNEIVFSKEKLSLDAIELKQKLLSIVATE